MLDCYNGMYDGYCGYADGAPFNFRSKAYWERSLFQRMRTLFIFDGLPEENWDKDAFLFGLYKIGFLAVFKSRTYGDVFQPATPYGIGLNFQPVGMNINTPFFRFDRPLIIGRECEVIKLTPDYHGIWDIVSRCAEELMLLDVAIRLASINARFAYMIAASDDKSARSVKAILERLTNGEPAVVYNVNLAKQLTTSGSDTRIPWEQFDRDLKKNFILPELLEARRTTLTDFYREIGIRIAPDKKERIQTREAVSYDAETFNRREVWNISLQESLRRVNDFLGTNITARYNEPIELTELNNGEEGYNEPIPKPAD